MMKKGIIFLCWLAAAGWMWAIFYLSTLPEGEVPRAGTLMPDYINHGAAYLLLAFLLSLALQRTWRCSFITTFVVIVGWCLVFGLGMEFAQKYLTATRHFSLLDLLADGIGAAMLFLVLLALQKARNMGKR
ncbi:VanZ family protein [Chloroflexota bacterium]